jgi:hypothetical protein
MKGVDACRRSVVLGQRKISNKRVAGAPRECSRVRFIIDVKVKRMRVAIITLFIITLVPPPTSYFDQEACFTLFAFVGQPHHHRYHQQAINNKRGLCSVVRKGVAHCCQVSIFCDSGSRAA